MKKITTTLFSSLLCVIHTAAQAQSFVLRKSTDLFDVTVEVQCQQSNCHGPATITLYEKGTQKVIQQFESDDLALHLNKSSASSMTDLPLPAEQNALIFKDFDFDGREDIAIKNGNTGAYGGPIYDIYVFNDQWGKFVYNEALSMLTNAELGMFELDHHQKRIIAFSQSGCCYHVRTEYSIRPGQELLLVRELIEDTNSSKNNKVKVTHRVLVDGQWKQSVKYYPLLKYYQ